MRGDRCQEWECYVKEELLKDNLHKVKEAQGWWWKSLKKWKVEMVVIEVEEVVMYHKWWIEELKCFSHNRWIFYNLIKDLWHKGLCHKKLILLNLINNKCLDRKKAWICHHFLNPLINLWPKRKKNNLQMILWVLLSFKNKKGIGNIIKKF